MKYLVVKSKWNEYGKMPCKTWRDLRRAVITAKVNGYKYKLVEAAE